VGRIRIPGRAIRDYDCRQIAMATAIRQIARAIEGKFKGEREC
jgi:hypothetical protein